MFLSYIFLNSPNWILNMMWSIFVVQIFPSLNDNPILWHEQSIVRGLTLSFSFLSTFLCVQKFYRRNSLKKHYHVLYTRNICKYIYELTVRWSELNWEYIYISRWWTGGGRLSEKRRGAKRQRPLLLLH